VAVGDVVAVIEAMKMKTEVVSDAAGQIRSIAATVGQPAEAGAVLVVVG
jgi:biotin carboxyl carrier protein